LKIGRGCHHHASEVLGLDGDDAISYGDHVIDLGDSAPW
jgi:hypothetical protein